MKYVYIDTLNKEKILISKKDPIHVGQRLVTNVRCHECNRVFDLLDETDANEYYYGHDCEAL
jgi:hypothetical protein